MATAEDGLPNGHAAIDRRVLQCFHKRGFHVLPAQRNTNFPRLSKSFCLEKNSASPDLSPERTVVN
jgi:hypothetical protein